MITLAFRFPGGRYHATPWGHQVNEGQVEWPPCPWRILRALISCGYSRLGWTEIPPTAKSLLEKLAVDLPDYTLPNASIAHSRHYMPIPGANPTLVMDTWLNIAGEIQIHWHTSVEDEEIALLESLVTSMSYLGRSESWVEGRVVSKIEERIQANCVPHLLNGSQILRHEFLASALAPMSERDYGTWRNEQLSGTEAPTDKLTKAQIKAQEKITAPFPANMFDALQWDTSKWKGFGWSQPPGSRWVQYRCPNLASESTANLTSSRTSAIFADVVLLALASPSGNSSALPTLSRMLPQAELLHKALVSRADTGDGVIPHELSGCGDDRKPLQGHGHAHILPVDLDGDGHLDHFLLWAPMGFRTEAMQAIRNVRRTWMKGNENPLRLALAGYGMQNGLDDIPDGLRCIVGKAKEWSSISPFVPPRFVKKNGSNSAKGQIRAELLARGFPAPESIEFTAMPGTNDSTDIQRAHFRHYVRRRSHGGALPPQDVGWFVRLTFSEDVQGPLALGYGSHFGMGLFQVSTRTQQ